MDTLLMAVEDQDLETDVEFVGGNWCREDACEQGKRGLLRWLTDADQLFEGLI